jgi:nucleotide-binding universal stress UspA family protein
MKTLLALINSPVNSETFIRYAAEMAADMGYGLQLIYVLNPAAYTLTTGTAAATAHPAGTEIDVARIEEEQRIAIQAIREKLEKVPEEISSRISADVSTETGALDIVVNKYVEDNRADMLLVENQHEEGFWVLDTNTQLIMDANCPALLIPYGANYQQPRKIVYATDYNQRDAESIKKLIEFAGSFSPDITALHIIDSDDQEEKEKMSEFRESITANTNYDKIEVETLTDEKDKGLAENLNDYAQNAGAQLIVLLKANRTFFERIFKSSTTKKVIKKARLPLLIFHEKEFE